MTEMQDIDEMPAGREMDALIAEVMGYQPVKARWFQSSDVSAYDSVRYLIKDASGEVSAWERPDDGRIVTLDTYALPPFSIDITAAWEVVEAMRWWKAENDLSEDGSVMWHFRVGTPPRHRWFSAQAPRDQAPLAICRAALKAIEAGAQ